MTQHDGEGESAWLVEERRAILDAAMFEVPFDGWSDATLGRAAVAAGFDAAMAIRAFPGGAAEAIAFWSDEADREMFATYAATAPEGLRLREKIALLVRLRIETMAGHREAVRKSLNFLAQPQQAGRGLRSLYRTVDEIWFAAGDGSTDFSFYTKRATLAGVYSTTVLAWLDDESEGFAETWAFLERRIDDVMRIPRLRARLRPPALPRRANLPDPARFARRVRERLRETERH